MGERDAARSGGPGAAAGGNARAVAGRGPLGHGRLRIVLRRHRRLIVGAVAVALAAAGIALATAPPQFRATAVVAGVEAMTAAGDAAGTRNAKADGDFERVASTPKARRVVDQLKLWENPEFTRLSVSQRLAADVLALIGRRPKDDTEAVRQRAMRRFQDAVTVRSRGNAGLLEIGFTSRDPAIAAQAANALAAAYVDEMRAGRADSTLRAMDALRERVETLRARLRQSERAVEAYLAEHKIRSDTERTMIEGQIAALEKERDSARQRTVEARARLARLEQAAGTREDAAARDEALQSRSAQRLRATYAAVVRREAELSIAYGSRHPRLARTRVEIANLARLIDGEIARAAAGARDAAEAAQAVEASLERELARLRDEAAQGRRADARLRELQQEADASRSRFEQALDHAKAAVERQSLRVPDARIVSRAFTPGRPQYRPFIPALLAAAVGGLAAGLGLAFAAQGRGRGYRTCADVEAELPVACLGFVPLLPSPGRKGRGAGAERAVSEDLHRFGIAHPAARETECLRAILKKVGPTGPRRPGEVLLVTSALPGEGCSTVASNLAHLAARGGARTLLISPGFAQPPLAARHGAAIAALVKSVRSEIAVEHAVGREPASGLYSLAAPGRGAFRDAVIEGDEARFRGMLDAARKTFDLIVVDGPAIAMTVRHRLPLDHADRVLLVVEWRRTAREKVAAALRAIGTRIDKIAGVVLNKVDRGE